jgi:hypothetical protein
MGNVWKHSPEFCGNVIEIYRKEQRNTISSNDQQKQETSQDETHRNQGKSDVSCQRDDCDLLRRFGRPSGEFLDSKISSTYWRLTINKEFWEISWRLQRDCPCRDVKQSCNAVPDTTTAADTA